MPAPRASTSTSSRATPRRSCPEGLRGIAEREGANPAAAREHAGPRGAAPEVSDEEFFDVASQLPTDYGGLLVGSPR